MRNILHCLWACAGRAWQHAPKQPSPKFFIKTLSKFEKFLPKFSTFFKNNKLLIPTIVARRAIFPTPILQNPPHPTALAPPALKNDNQLTMVTREDAAGNGGASKGGEGRGGRWQGGGGQEQQSPTTTMTKSSPLLHLQLKK